MNETYFNKEDLKAKARKLKGTPGVPSWLPGSLNLLADHAHRFPPEKDEDRYVVEFVYPL
ncbi:MAG: hypothetical protein V1913_14100 [Fibrobacterota bacterium]